MQTVMSGTKVIQQDITVSLTCNRCGKTIDNINEPSDEICGFDITPIKINCGYGSIRDGDTITFDLCDHCIEDMLESFKISATITNNMYPL